MDRHCQFGPIDVVAGGDHNGFISTYETKSGKLIKQEKAPMHVHQFTTNEERGTYCCTTCFFSSAGLSNGALSVSYTHLTLPTKA